jgi:hypothetical protein
MLDGCITDLVGDDFWSFNVLTVRLSDICLFVADSFHWTGHYKLWLSGVHHRDVSAFNLMYKRR